MGLAERSARRQPLDLLSGDRGDTVVLLVVVQDGNAGGLGLGLGRGCDQDIGAHRAVVQSALVGELLVDLEGAMPFMGGDRATRGRVKRQVRCVGE